MKNKILLVEDDDLILASLKFFLEGKNYEVLVANDGKSALEIFESQPVLVVITDLHMPIMDGRSLVNNLLEFPDKPVILVHSSASDMKIVIELMQRGVYDYLLKPINFSELILRVNKAYEIAELRQVRSQIEKERELRISHLLKWKEENSIPQKPESSDGNLIGSIRTSFSQGAGLGSLLSIAGRIRKKAVEKEDCFEVNKPLLNLLFENAEVARKVISCLEEIDSIQTTGIEFEIYSATELYEILANISKKLNEYKKIKNNEISLNENMFLHYPQKIKINRIHFEKAISEILFNSFKFSRPDSIIYILIEVQQTKVIISILNSPGNDVSTVNGILPEYSNIIFEPFFRISKLVFESIPTLDFGLGLTMVDKVIRRHNGKVKALSLTGFPNTKETNHSDTLVNFEIELPLLNE